MPPPGRKAKGAGLGVIKKAITKKPVPADAACRSTPIRDWCFLRLPAGLHLFLNPYEPTRTAAVDEEIKAAVKPAE
ncbi:MAG: hypothetical protein ACOX8W_06950 [bacterium]|jgi:hypothetical protein